MHSIVIPKGHKGNVLNKYGFKTETSGTVKVRQQQELAPAYTSTLR